MHFPVLTSLAFAGSVLARPLFPRQAADPSTDLANWMTEAIKEFQPDHLGWQVAYDKYFSPDLFATFNSTHYNFTTFKLFYTAVETLVGLQYSDFAINVTNIVAVPDPGTIGGRAYVLGVEAGHRRDSGALVSATDGTFAVVSVEAGQRKITEMRESNNFPTG